MKHTASRLAPRPAPPPAQKLFDGTTSHPAANIAVILIAVALARNFTPEEVRAAGVLKPTSMMLAGSLVFGMLLRLWRNPAAIFNPISVVAAAPVYWLLLDPMQGAYPLEHVTTEQVRGAYLCIALFSSGVWIAALHRPWPVPHFVRSAAGVALTPGGLFAIATTAFILAFLRFAVPAEFDVGAMIAAFSSPRWSAPWARGQMGGWDSFLDHFSYFGYILPALAVLHGRAVGWSNPRTLMALAYAIVIAALLSVGGGRRIVGVLAGSGFVVWFLSSKPPRFKHLLVFAGFVALLLWFLQLMLAYRAVGLAHAFDPDSSFEARRLEYVHVDDNFLRTCELVGIMPDKHPHVGMQWLTWVLVRPVPRVFWPGKPISPGFDLPTYHGLKGVSLSTSLVGELYMAFAFLGCLGGGWVLGRLALALRDLLNEQQGPGSLILFGSGLMTLFAGLRSGIDLVLMSYGTLSWVALVWMHKKFRSR